MRASIRESNNSAVISIREMRPTDVPAALAILRESPEAAMWSENSLMEGCSRGNTWVAVVDGNIAGVLIAQTAADELEILNLAIKGAQRRKGVASNLVNARLERAFAQGVRGVYLELRASNSSALAFYGNLGFQICGRRVNYYRNPAEDAILMVLHRPNQND